MVREEAQRLGLNGEVHIRADGVVEVWAEGEPAAVDQLIEWCGHGPPPSEVVGVDVVEVEPDHAQGFGVAH
ncbi:MAG: acylphosphatase [Actinomycetia bacterium]|nr:acylphosphatase [Actinomycetes bacterium]